MADHWIQRIARFDRRIKMQAVAHIINALGFSMSYPFLSIYLHSERGYSMQIVGTAFLVMGVARTVGPLISGILCDRFGRRRALIIAPAGNIVSNLALAYCIHCHAELGTLMIFLFLIQFASAFYLAAAETIITDITPQDQHSEVYSLIRIAQNIGWMLGPAIGSWLVKTPYSLLFCLTAGAMAVVLFISVYYTPEVISENDAATAGGLTATLRRSHGFLVFNILFLLILMLSSQLVSTLSVFITKDLNIARTTLGYAYALNGLLIIFLQAPIIAALQRVSLGARLSLGAILYVFGYTGLAFIQGAQGLYICVAVLTLGEILVMHTTMIATARYAPKNAVGRFFGVLGLTRGIGLTVGPFVGGFLYDRFSHHPLAFWGTLSAASLVAAVLFISIRHPELKAGDATVRGE